MSRLYIALLATAAFAVSFIGATFSLVGLTQLFAGSPFSVGLMAGSLEFAKLVVAGFLYRYWGHINRVMRYYLSIAVASLCIITSLGIFGFLSSAYQTSSANYKTQNTKKENLVKQLKRVEGEISKTEKFIDSIPRSRISKKFTYYEESRQMMARLNKQAEKLQAEIATLEVENISTQREIGPLLYVAEIVGVNVDSVAKFLILMFVSVFDPLAICLVFGTNLAIRLREKYRGNEAKIAALAVAKPVDHRFKRSQHKKAA